MTQHTTIAGVTALATAQAADVALTVAAVTSHPLDVTEANPLARAAIESVGLTPALVLLSALMIAFVTAVATVLSHRGWTRAAGLLYATVAATSAVAVIRNLFLLGSV